MIKLLILIAFTLAVAYYDYRKISKKKWITDHRSRFVFRFLCVTLVGFGDIFHTIGLYLIFAAIFDPILNTMRGLGFYYLGTEARWDLFWSEHLALYKIARWLMLIVGLILLCYEGWF